MKDLRDLKDSDDTVPTVDLVSCETPGSQFICFQGYLTHKNPPPPPYDLPRGLGTVVL